MDGNDGGERGVEMLTNLWPIWAILTTVALVTGSGGKRKRALREKMDPEPVGTVLSASPDPASILGAIGKPLTSLGGPRALSP
jgi:hypothetical protein